MRGLTASCAMLTLFLPIVAGTASARATVINAGQILDVVSGRLLADRTIVVVDDRIASVGRTGSMELPANAEVIDLGDMTLLPGLLDMHVHLTGDPDAQGYKNLAASTPRNALFGAANALRTLRAGFTSVRNVGAGGFADIALRDAINHGDVPGPRMRASGPSLGITGGHCDNNLLPPRFDSYSDGVADGP